MALAEKVSSFPVTPGVYLMKNQAGEVLYVGKAKNLRDRLKSYFSKEATSRTQIQFLMKRVVVIETIVTGTEKEALLLENTLIKKHKPKYNIQLRDDKNYVSVRLSVKDEFPRIYVTRQIKEEEGPYFGPYSSASACRETVDFIEKYFQLRTCSDHELKNRSRPCLQYQIKRCLAPCVGFIQEEPYRQLVENVRLFLEGRKKDLLQKLKIERNEASEKLDFEKAARLRDLIQSMKETLEKQSMIRYRAANQDFVSYYREGEQFTFCVLMVRAGRVQGTRLYHFQSPANGEEMIASFLLQYYGEDRYLPQEIVTRAKRGEKKELLRLAEKNAMEGFKRHFREKGESADLLLQLQQQLSLKKIPAVMECYDISNTQGAMATGSLVTFLDGIPAKEHYKRFKIKTVFGPNDFEMMYEVLKRRLMRSRMTEAGKSRWQLPDLIVVDGGKGQLGMALKALEELGITGIDVIGLAKKKEGEKQDKVFLPGRKNPILLKPHSSILHLLMQIRDEAHRFAITYHKKLRGKAFLGVRR
ncbi:MAG: excinuclease ABC subunit C [Deltaproteobacteria bacterium]|nr:excinuclease ABC subunit C [Deltaproteobacteria bacterium]